MTPTPRQLLWMPLVLLVTACPEGPQIEGDGGTDGGAAVDAGNPPLTDAGPGLLSRPANPTCLAPQRPMLSSGVQVTRAFTGLTFSLPMLLLQAPATPDRVFVMERAGVVKSFPNRPDAGTPEVRTVIDIDARVNDSGEGGLLGMAFHPQWPTRKELFLSYTRDGSPLVSVISRFRTTDDGLTFDPASEERLLELDQPYTNHNGGNIAFGPDGFLYIGFGDGGSGGDPLGSGQRTDTNLGKFLRIDVNVPAAQRYAIPPTNPFASGTVCNNGRSTMIADAGAGQTRCAEIYALGVRNPWRWSFDTGTGDLWAGDVGQGTWEEVDVITNGGNYGWRTCEGFFRQGSTTNRCNTPGFIDPVVAYDRNVGQSITGGYVYRGSTIPGLVGRFVFGDYQTGIIMAVAENPVTGERTIEQLADTNLAISSFGQTLDGEIFVLGLTNGQIHRLAPMGTPMASTFPQRLSQTGCFDPMDVKKPGPMLIPYDLNSPLWSDGAEKARWFAIPDGTTIRVGADGDFEFPNGTVTVKTFLLGGKRIETRLLMRHPDGQWAGYSYEWRDDESDADLLPAGKTKVIGAQTWQYPSRAQCLSCHTAAAGRSLGPEVAQLNRDLVYPRNVIANQLETLETIGMLSAPLAMPVSGLPRLEPANGSGSAEAKARAYLHSNCSVCHRNGAGQGPQDFRYSLSFAQMNVCNTAPLNGDTGVARARLLTPMDPAQSLISLRMKALNTFRMPPLGSSVVHGDGVSLIDAWINGVTACP
ncbi:MAG: hypothetical protein GQE15_39470 [Archangiaceae bacterium]|nr:hypothetical protein [Archangiaceae bacterium]